MAVTGGIIIKPGVCGALSVTNDQSAWIVWNGEKSEVLSCSHPFTMGLGTRCGVCGESLYQKFLR